MLAQCKSIAIYHDDQEVWPGMENHVAGSDSEPNLVRGGVFLLLYPDPKLLPEIAFSGREDIRKSSRVIISV